MGALIPPVPPGVGGGAGSELAWVAALAGLAREVEELRRAVDPLRDVGARVQDLARLLAQLSDTVAVLSKRPGPTPAPSWLLAPTDPVIVARVLDELCAWLHTVFLRYPDGASALPPCWLYHPEVVEELLWLMHAWCAAYQGKTASVALAGDWHERQRPGVVRRIRTSAGSCSTEKHQTRPGWDQHPTGATPVPGIDSVTAIATWWASRRDEPGPEPATATPQPAGSATNGTSR